jgi:hypothetical protein
MDVTESQKVTTPSIRTFTQLDNDDDESMDGDSEEQECGEEFNEAVKNFDEDDVLDELDALEHRQEQTIRRA